MPTESPVRYGFRTVWRGPSLALAEIAWRWVWGGSVLLIAWFAAAGYLHSLTVSKYDQFRLSSGNPQWMADAIVHIFSGSGPTVLRLGIIVAPAAIVLWISAATFGRAASLRALVGNGKGLLGRTFALHLWRVVVGVLAFAGIVASFALGVVLMAKSEPPQPLIFMAVFFPLAVLFTAIRSRINWFLLLANVYAAEGRPAGRGFGEAVRGFKRRSGEFMSVGTIVGVIRIVLMGVVTGISFALLPGIGVVPGKVLWAVFVLVTLVYFAVSDWLYAVKLAAYARIVHADIVEGSLPSAASMAEPASSKVPIGV
ncbi:MAG: hypothetical protein HYX28_06690 [Candidatus Koribacter versatilis]|uniref:Uncharacterized protein n=1 Tax=Candidatus Korobacter versatilis TaxID=658062 RepID=A0A932A9C5_9BACT|nr:hypothetical protein [Candidatus Koribacter versatilis]